MMKRKIKLLLTSSLFFIAMIAKAQTDTTWHVNGVDSIKTDNHAQIGNGLKVIGHLVADSIKVKSLHVGDSSLVFSTIGGVDMIQTNSSSAEIAIGTIAPPNSGFFSWLEVGIGIHHPTHMLHLNDSTWTHPGRPVNMAFTGWGNGWGTGTTAKDGFQIGINGGKVAELNQQENLDMLFYTGNNNPAGTVLNAERMRIIGRTGAWQGNVAIGTSTPDSSALLHVSSNNKGVLIPNVALDSVTDGLTIVLPATSLLVYNTGTGGLSPAGYWYNAGTSTSPNWVNFGTSNGWNIVGNSGTTASTAAIGSTVTDNFIGTTDYKDWVMATNNLERMRIKANGNVGIGTVSPNGTLSIVSTNTTGTTTSSSLNVSANSLTTGTTAYLSSSSITSGRLLDLNISGTNGANSQRALNISMTGAHSASSVGSYGGVIINGHTGTSSTNFGLYSEAKDATTNYAVFARANGANASNIGLYATVSGGTSNYNLYLSTLAAGTNNYSLYSPALAKSYFAGNVGIGTPNPTTLLHISGNGNFTFDPTPVTSGYTTAFVMDDTGLKIGHDSPNRDMELQTNSTTRMTILQGGNVGIGTTTPGYKLTVNGDAHVTGIMGIGITPDATYRLKINGDGYASGSWLTSDQQFKTEIDNLQNALATIKQLKPKTYYFDTANVYGLNFSSNKQYGFLAQDLEEVLPELVKASNKGADLDTLGNVIHPAVDFKAINYIELIAILTKGIQELEERNDTLKAKVINQDSTNTSLQNQVNLLQNQLLVTNSSLQEQVNELMLKINNCCNRPQESSTNNSETKSIIISENGTTQTDVELNNSQTTVLEQNHPNPYAERTSINYYLPENTGKAEIKFYNTQGKLIKSVELIQKGKGTLNVFAGDLSSGTYTYSLIVDGQIVETKKMVKQ